MVTERRTRTADRKPRARPSYLAATHADVFKAAEHAFDDIAAVLMNHPPIRGFSHRLEASGATTKANELPAPAVSARNLVHCPLREQPGAFGPRGGDRGSSRYVS